MSAAARYATGCVLALQLAACSESDPKSDAAKVATGPNAPAGGAPAAFPAPDIPTPPPLVVPPLESPDDPRAVAINEAAWPAAPAKAGFDPTLLRAQVLLARAHFSPGVIDGKGGDNVRKAIAAYKTARGLDGDGRLDEGSWRKLTQEDAGPAVVAYTISAADVEGPFGPEVPPDDYAAMAKLDAMRYRTPLEALAEKFHMDEALLKALNPEADFSEAGGRILVAALGETRLAADVKTIEVDKTNRQVRALDANGHVLGVYPATVGSKERPAPTGTYAVKGVAHDPTYTYDPSRLTFGDKSAGKLMIKPGPNNPVGAVWIDLDVPTYGIHGAPDPRLVGKVASHGCVRLTNWDARELAAAVQPGVKVAFTGAAGTPRAASKS